MKPWQALLVATLFALAASSLAQGASPTITTPPTSVTNNARTTAVFTVGAGGTSPLHYQWRKNGAALSGATTSSLVLSNVLQANQGSYTVVVTNSSGAVTSSVAKLTVIDPVITEQPYTFDETSQVVHSNAVIAENYADFYVNAAGTEPLRYQWRFWKIGGTIWANIPGETTTNMLIPSVQASNAGSYSVVVSNALGGKVTSSNAILTVLEPPTITTQPQSKAVTAGTDVSLSVLATGTPPLQYQWFKNLFQIPFATNADFTLTNVQPSDAGSYEVEVYNAAGSTPSTGATLTVNIPPIILTQPLDRTVKEGYEYVDFGVVIDPESAEPLEYQWYYNGNLIPGATDSTYMIVHIVNPGPNQIEDYFVDASDAGTYRVKIQNVAGTVFSSNAILIVLVPPRISQQPVSQNIWTNTQVTFTVAVDPTSTMPLSYQWFFNDPEGIGDPIPILGATGINLTFLVTNMNQYAAYSCEVSNAVGTTNTAGAVLTVVQETTKPTVTILSPADLATGTEPTITVRGAAADNAAVRFVQYYLAGDYSVTNQATTTNGWTNWVATFPAVIGENIFQAEAFDTSGNQSTLTPNRRFYRVVSDRLTLAIVPPGAGTVSGVTNGQGLAINSNYTATASVNSALDYAFTNWARTTNGTHWVTSNVPVLNFVMQSNLTVQANFAAKLPSISAQPQSLTAIAGGNPTFTVTAAGAAPLSYQWRFNSVNITGANGANYSVINAQPANVGTYSVVVTNVAGSVTSSTATLTVISPPVITMPPADSTNNAGTDAIFTVTATGTGPLRYQWMKDGTNSLTNGSRVSGAITPTLTLSRVRSDDAGSYSVVVTNAAASVTSSKAVLTVIPVLYFDMSPAGLGWVVNGFRLTIKDLLGRGPVTIYVSTNMVDWKALLTNPPVTGAFQFIDIKATNQVAPGAENSEPRFYRATEQW